jgi:small nuclear ribonucleoprotein (snRNP)-like protein
MCLYINLNLSEIEMSNYDAPLDFVRKSIGSVILVRLRNKVNIRGELVAYDDHLNMMIKDASLKR